MSLILLVPLSILMGLIALGAFFWAIRRNQFDDPEGAAWRVLDPKDPMEKGGQGLHPAPDEEPDDKAEHADEQTSDEDKG